MGDFTMGGGRYYMLYTGFGAHKLTSFDPFDTTSTDLMLCGVREQIAVLKNLYLCTSTIQ